MGYALRRLQAGVNIMFKAGGYLYRMKQKREVSPACLFHPPNPDS
jgi:hypothetical protein